MHGFLVHRSNRFRYTFRRSLEFKKLRPIYHLWRGLLNMDNSVKNAKGTVKVSMNEPGLWFRSAELLSHRSNVNILSQFVYIVQCISRLRRGGGGRCVCLGFSQILLFARRGVRRRYRDARTAPSWCGLETYKVKVKINIERVRGGGGAAPALTCTFLIEKLIDLINLTRTSRPASDSIRFHFILVIVDGRPPKESVVERHVSLPVTKDQQRICILQL